MEGGSADYSEQYNTPSTGARTLYAYSSTGILVLYPSTGPSHACIRGSAKHDFPTLEIVLGNRKQDHTRIFQPPSAFKLILHSVTRNIKDSSDSGGMVLNAPR